jgi:hypothetical protein
LKSEWVRLSRWTHGSILDLCDEFCHAVISKFHLSTTISIQSPKREALRNRRWYDFYAMYSSQFVDSALQKVGVGEKDWILDPWNGIGTTTSAAWRLGINAVGLDINPAMVLIAKGRLLQHADIARLFDLGKTIEQMERPAHLCPPGADPLHEFFLESGVGFVRGIERALRQYLGTHGDPESDEIGWVENCCPLLACLYVAIFRSVRKLFSAFNTSNPTWFKKPASGNRASFTWECFRKLIVDSIFDAGRIVEDDHCMIPVKTPDVRVALCDSRQIQSQSQKVSLTMTSPPYCTRIDYAVATLPELMVLRLGQADFRRLRESMIGTPAIDRDMGDSAQLIGSDTCRSVLQAISRHSSYAAARYYSKTFKQYFAGIFRSLQGISRMTKAGGHAVIVVQDSYFKDVKIDLPVIYREYLECSGWQFIEQTKFKTRTKGAIHRFAGRYRRTADATESVLIFERDGK